MSVCPSIPPCNLYFPLYHMFSYIIGTWGHLCTPYVLGSFGGHHYICHGFLCLLVHPLPLIHNSDTSCSPFFGFLLYGTGCLWMYDMLFAFVPIFVVSEYVSSFYYHGYNYYSFCDCCVLWYIKCSSEQLPWPPPWWGFQQYQVSMMWFCCHHCHQGTFEVVALPLCHSSILHLRFLFRLMPIIPWVLHW